MSEIIKGGETIKYATMQLVQRLYSNLRKRLKERKEEKNWKESLSIKILESDKLSAMFLDKIKIVKIQDNCLIYKCKYLLPVGSSYEKLESIEISRFPKNIQDEIKQFLRERKLKRLIYK